MELKTKVGKDLFILRGRAIDWRLEHWWRVPGRKTGWYAEEFDLYYDKRHRRLFLSASAERRVGVAGIAALERLARRALGSPRALAGR